MPQEELAIMGLYSFDDNGKEVDLFRIGYMESKGFEPGFYVHYDDEVDGPFILPSEALSAAVRNCGGMYGNF